MMKGVKILMVVFVLNLLSSVGFVAQSQQTTELKVSKGISADSLRRAVVGVVMKKLKKDHYKPKPVNDLFSVNVWEQFIQNLDGNKNIFLQEDIDKLAAFKYAIDDQINNNSTLFFDSAWSIYSTRIKECQVICETLFNAPFNLAKKDTFQFNRKEAAYAATNNERISMWTSHLKLGILKNYIDIESSEGKNNANTSMDAAIEIKAREKVKNWYNRHLSAQLNEAAINEKFALYVNAITLEMDPHSVYVFPSTQDKLKSAVSRSYAGIGIELGVDGADAFVKRMVTDGPAYKSGLVKENDRILQIADKTGKMVPTNDLSYDNMVEMIRGEKGTTIDLVLKQTGVAERRVTLTRHEFKEVTKGATSAVITKDGKKIGFVHLPMFYGDKPGVAHSGCSYDVAVEVEKLLKLNVEGIVFDLRGNGGGSLSEVTRMLSIFIPSSPVSLLRTKDSLTVYNSSVLPNQSYTGPLVVLIDERSASASEIFAAAIQDYKRGLIVGTTYSFGKGTAQAKELMGKYVEDEHGSSSVSYGSMWLTRQKFYRATGTTTQLIGVKADIALIGKAYKGEHREIAYKSALLADTIATGIPVKAMQIINYDKVVSLANERIAKTKGFKEIDNSIAVLNARMKKAIPLDLAGFKSHTKELSQLEKAVQTARELKNDSLQFVPSVTMGSMAAEVNSEDSKQKLYNEWLRSLNKDLMIQESLKIVQDIIRYPLSK